jgi:hypothetical protein
LGLRKPCESGDFNIESIARLDIDTRWTIRELEGSGRWIIAIHQFPWKDGSTWKRSREKSKCSRPPKKKRHRADGKGEHGLSGAKDIETANTLALMTRLTRALSLEN